ncbi:MAG: RidA family protein [Actinomycetia bacterium]|nr:RidA family protein [Actinomycetes bacterium]
MNQVDHPDGGYAYIPAIAPYSAGVVAKPGFRIRRVTLNPSVPWVDGFALIDRVIGEADRPARALCSIELRCPTPHSFAGFGSFNDDYRSALAARDILLDDGVNPVARTNVAPAVDPVEETHLLAFGYTVPVAATDGARPSFITSGAGDVYDQSDMRPEAIVGGTTGWEESGVERTVTVLDEIERRLEGLGASWSETDIVDAYTAENLTMVLGPTVLARLGSASRRGVHWYYARPPVSGLLYEMDARGGVEEVLAQRESA